MTKAEMQSLVTAITNAGFPATVSTVDGGTTWLVRSNASGFSVNVNVIKNLADAQGVTAKVAEVEYT